MREVATGAALLRPSVAMIRAIADHAYMAMRPAFTAALLTAVLLAGCGDEDGATTDDAGAKKPAGAAETAAAKPTTTIKIVDFVYDPTPATVTAGREISVPNADAAPHTITADGSGEAFDSGTIQGNATGSLTIDKPGTYTYICEFHPFMKGEVIVTK